MLSGRVRPHTLLLGAAAAVVCVRAATGPASGTAAALTTTGDETVLAGSVPVMVSISGPIDVRSAQPASLGTAVHLAADGEAIDGATVVLERRTGGEAAPWAETARAMTDRLGRAIFIVPVASPNTQFRARSLPDPRYAAAASAVITVVTR